MSPKNLQCPLSDRALRTSSITLSSSSAKEQLDQPANSEYREYGLEAGSSGTTLGKMSATSICSKIPIGAPCRSQPSKMSAASLSLTALPHHSMRSSSGALAGGGALEPSTRNHESLKEATIWSGKPLTVLPALSSRTMLRAEGLSLMNVSPMLKSFCPNAR